MHSVPTLGGGLTCSHIYRLFADIHKSYNDDIEAYVKDMFKTSILIDNKQNQRFLRKPSAEKLQNDAGVSSSMATTTFSPR